MSGRFGRTQRCIRLASCPFATRCHDGHGSRPRIAHHCTACSVLCGSLGSGKSHRNAAAVPAGAYVPLGASHRRDAGGPFQRICPAWWPSHGSPSPRGSRRMPPRRKVAPSHSVFGRNMVRSRAFHQPPFRLFICIGQKNKCVARCGRKKNVSNCMDFQEKAYFCPPNKRKGGFAQHTFPSNKRKL